MTAPHSLVKIVPLRSTPVPESAEELLGNPRAIYANGELVTLRDALGDAEYLALCFSASYCPSCRFFMPALQYAYRQGGLESEKKCKVLLVGGDKTEEAFDLYRGKYPQFLSLSFEATQAMKTTLREMWQISTIPHVVLVERQFASVVERNVRVQIERDPRCGGFPWTGQAAVDTATGAEGAAAPDGAPQQHWTLAERIRKRPRCHQLGHFAKGGSGHMYMDENAVRARAGLLNITSWIAIVNMLHWREPAMLIVAWPLVAWDMLAAALFGLTPLSPYGMLGTVLAFAFGPAEPTWKPAGPKRFAWIVGLCLVNTCGLAYVLELRALMIAAIVMCNAATWAESVLGFCVGCWMWNTIIAPRTGQQACQECKL